jgi:hypothetical protein
MFAGAAQLRRAELRTLRGRTFQRTNNIQTYVDTTSGRGGEGICEKSINEKYMPPILLGQRGTRGHAVAQ